MSIVLVDARHYGEQLRRARRMLNINCLTAAKILHISVHALHKYEKGGCLIPPDVICTLLHRGFAMSVCHVYNAKKNKHPKGCFFSGGPDRT